MVYRRNLILNKCEEKTINHYLHNEPKDWMDCLSEDETIAYTVCFDNGVQMDIKCCGVEYRDGACNKAWTEAVLFDKRGRELCFTEPGEEYFGAWHLEHDGNIYIVSVFAE